MRTNTTNYREGRLGQGMAAKFFLLTMLFGFSMGVVQAQQVYGLQEYFAEEEIGPGDRLHNFVYGNVPTIVVSDQGKFYPDAKYPQKVDGFASAFAEVNSSDPMFRTVKMLQLHITEASQISNIVFRKSMLDAFVNLEYVFIVSDVPLTLQQVRGMVSGLADTDILIFYQVEIPQ